MLSEKSAHRSALIANCRFHALAHPRGLTEWWSYPKDLREDPAGIYPSGDHVDWEDYANTSHAYWAWKVDHEALRIQEEIDARTLRARVHLASLGLF